MMPRRGERGYALIAVIAVMALLVVYLVTVNSMVEVSHAQARRLGDRLTAGEIDASLLAEYGRVETATSSTLTIELRPGVSETIRISRAPIGPQDPAWTAMPGLAPREGDLLMIIERPETQGPGRVNRYLVNARGLRRGAVALAVQAPQ